MKRNYYVNYYLSEQNVNLSYYCQDYNPKLNEIDLMITICCICCICFSVIGPKVNMAARLMMNYPGKLSCDEETHHRSSIDTSHFHDLPEIKLKGMDSPGPISEYIDSSM